MGLKLIKLNLIVFGFLFFITGSSKILSATGGAKILQYPDPLLLISNKHVFQIIGACELIAAGICFFGKRVVFRVLITAWISTAFFAYHLGLFLINYDKPCPCLGNLTDVLALSPQQAHFGSLLILTYLLFGSYFSFFWMWHLSKTNLLEIPKNHKS